MTFLSLLLFLELAPALTLSQDYVIKRALSASPHIKKIQLKKEGTTAFLEGQRHSLYGWSLVSGLQTGRKNPPRTFPFEPLQQTDNSLTFGVEKKLPLGLSFKTLYTDSFSDRRNNTVLNRVQAPDSIYRESLSLEINMDLLRNILGREERRALHLLSIGKNQADRRAAEEAEELVLKAVSRYWSSYRAYIALGQMRKGLKTYRQLVRETGDKKKHHFLKPGEAPQVLAEYENLKQEVSIKEQFYRDELKALFVILKTSPKWDSVSFEIKPPDASPPFKPPGGQKIRSLQILQEQIRERELRIKQAQSAFLPTIRLKGKTGLLAGGGAPNREDLFSGEKYSYELSLNLLYNPFSKTVGEKLKQEKYNLEESKTDLEILKKETENLITSLRERIQTARNNFQSAGEAGKYQQKAFWELKVSFSQGRTDVFELIRASAKLRESEIRKAAFLSEYHLLTVRLSALLDRLVDGQLKRD